MKLIYIPKYRNEKSPFKIAQIIQRVISNENVDGLVFLPGYMSTSQNSIQSFISQMQNLGVKNKTVLLFNGMNGIFSLPLGNNIRDEHLKQFAQNNTIINFKQKKNLSDHRKMLFFFRFDLKGDLNRTVFIEEDLSSFFSSIKIIGMLIGSSNQSFATYFSTAKKGEADLLMLHDGASFNNYQIDTEKEKNSKGTLIMAESDSISDTDEYFKNILRDIFENSF